MIQSLAWISWLWVSSQEQNFMLHNEPEANLGSNMIPGVLNASRDVFSRAVAYDFSQAYFRRRSLGPEQRSVLLNGVPMNKMNDGRANWSNWGGLNDALRHQVFDEGILPSLHFMGNMGGTVNINSLAETYRDGLKASIAVSNRNYATRWMVTYGSPRLKGNWKFNVSASTRFAEEGFREGTPYEAYSFLCSVDKQFSGNHFVNITTILAKNSRGMSSAITEEVFSLKGSQYNPHWGYQNEVKRNARVKRTFEPMVQVNYKWIKNAKTTLGAHLTYQWGSRGTSRLDYTGSRLLERTGVAVGGGVNPDPTYYQKLPSYFLRKPDDQNYAGAFFARERLLVNGQLNWEELFLSNKGIRPGGNSIYSLYEDRYEDFWVAIQGEFHQRLSKSLDLRGSVMANALVSERYAYLLDLLGGDGLLDIDPFDKGADKEQNDLRNPNRIAAEKEKFRYNYKMDATDVLAFVRLDHTGKRESAFVAIGMGTRRYQRTGFYENGSYPGNNSFGKGPVLRFSSYDFKAGLTYKFNGRHLTQLLGAYLEDPPPIRNSYSNPRENHDPVIGLTTSKSFGAEFKYQLRMPWMHLQLGTFLTDIRGSSSVSFYYADGLTGLNELGTSAFVQEVKTGLGRRSLGVELGVEFKIIDGLKAKGAATSGIAHYSESPELYLTSDDLEEPVFYGASNLKGYRIPNGPQEAYSLGVEYSDPDYWWIGVTLNIFKSSFLSVAPVTRTRNFYLDADGFAIPQYDESISKDLLRQEQLRDFNIVNLVGGKSWKINKTYLGFFLSVGNLLNATFKTGGYEQARNANYTTLLEDSTRESPLFAPKYWFGFGTTFFASIYVRIQQ